VCSPLPSPFRRAAFVLYQLIASRMTVGASTKPVTMKVLVASRDLALGALIQERISDRGLSDAAAGAILKKKTSSTAALPRRSMRTRRFTRRRSRPRSRRGIRATIPPGMRAFAVHVNEVVGVAGLPSPECASTCWFRAFRRERKWKAPAPSPDPPAEYSGSFSRTELPKGRGREPVLVQVVNLLVTPDQAEILTLATQQTIQLVLRNPSDKEIVSTPGLRRRISSGRKNPRAQHRSGKRAAGPVSAPPVPVATKRGR